MPAVSVVLVTYNHERYVYQAIRSVLAQTFPDFELVIVDDGSTDGTAEVVASFSDPRLLSIRQENQGPGAATNRALSACRGKYVALMSGDDMCHPQRLQRQLDAYACGGSRMLFSDVTLIGDDGSPVPTGNPYEGVFDVTPQTQAEIYHRFFFCGNFINGITAFTERILFGDSPYDPLLYQLQDFDVWIRLLKRYEFSFLPDRLVSYRIRSNQQNLSSSRPGHWVRHNNEYLFLMRRFFDDVPVELFRKAFALELLRPECSSPEELACEQAFLLLRVPHPMQWVIGLESLYRLLTNPCTAVVLRDYYEFTHREFVQLLEECDTLHLQRVAKLSDEILHRDRLIEHLRDSKGRRWLARLRFVADRVRSRLRKIRRAG